MMEKVSRSQNSYFDSVTVLSGQYDGIIVHINKKIASPVDCGVLLIVHINEKCAKLIFFFKQSLSTFF